MIEKIKFFIPGKFKLFLIISAILISVGLIASILASFGVTLFNYDIDFAGGTTMYYALNEEATPDVMSDVRQIIIDTTGKAPSSIQKTGDGKEIIIKTLEISTEIRDDIYTALTEKYDAELMEVNNVSPNVGSDIKKSAIMSSLIAAVLMLVYITIRFDFKSGLAAVICLLHDLLVILSVYVIFQIPMNMNFIAAALTILGYSINATVIIFDRIRENTRLDKRSKFNDIVDKSIWQTFTRSINTTLTTLFVVIMIIIFGVPSVRNFALPILVGIISGTYSSVFLAGPLWSKFRGKKSRV